MKRLIIIVFSIFTLCRVNAQSEIMQIIFNDGTVTTLKVEDIKEMKFDSESHLNLAYAGNYKGTNSVVVGGSFTYTVEIEYKITANDDGTINIDVPQYSLSNTIMGNLELGAYTIKNIAFDNDKNAFYREYGEDGIKQHFSAEKDGVKTMDADYDLKGKSNILIEKKGNIITIKNDFTLGAMPFPIVATFSNAVNQ